MKKGKLRSRTAQHRFSLAFDEIVANHVNPKVSSAAWLPNKVFNLFSFPSHDCTVVKQ